MNKYLLYELEKIANQLNDLHEETDYGELIKTTQQQCDVSLADAEQAVLCAIALLKQRLEKE